MSNNKIIILYLMMLVLHVAHVFEETWGRFWLIDRVYGLGWFLFANCVVFCIPVLLFYFVLQHKKWAYRWSIIYSGIMIINGAGHNIATIVTGRYFGGFAGGITGIGFLLIGPPLIHYLRKDLKLR
ncbi:MAG: hypothetical protein Q8916_13865 [Bacteroidota bacterium]|nr:hypothetical protein [Bacteroidota bacterium]